ncbi:MAG: saccharopine dehydrogenase-like oxidoreductase [Nitrospirota bacterium]
MIRIAVLGAGGLGKAAAKIIGMKQEMRLVAICDQSGYAFNLGGLTNLTGLNKKESNDSIGEIIKLRDEIDGIFVALPNLPNEFMPNIIKRFIDAGFSGVFTDALKRTGAMELMFKLDEGLKSVQSTYITGTGATPGLLTAAAVIAAQSFIEVTKVDIWWGVGISNWEEYKSTIREDIAHLPGWTVDEAKALSDEEIEKLLDERDGKLELHEMEHADDLLLEMVGVVDSRDKVTVGGIMDTRSAKKPVTTTMTLTGKTFDGKIDSHKFILGDETTMAANVVGPALGYLKRAKWLNVHGIYGIYGSTEFMPAVVK